MFVSLCGIAAGPRVGIAAACGINMGITLHIQLAAAGVSALLRAHPAAYEAIRYLGAAYLLWLAIQSWRAAAVISSNSAVLTAGAAVWRGFITNLLNPKTTLFIFAFIPQFTDPAHGAVWLQILFLGAIFLFNGFLILLFVGATAGALAQRLNRRVQVLNKLTALVFAALAVRLVLY